VKKIKFTKEFRSHLSEKLMDLGNLVIGGLVLAQFINTQTFSLPLLIAGIAIAALCYIITHLTQIK
jgi:hypothetical protein